MAKIEVIKKFCSITPRTQQMIDEIMANAGYVTFSEYVRAATDRYYEDFSRGQMYKKRTDGGGQSKKDKETREQEEQQEICDALGGTVQTGPDGSKVCVYYTYFERKRYEQRVSFALLNRDMIGTQYQPSREKVEQLQKEKKTQY